MAIDTLLPKKLGKIDASYKSVFELTEALSLAGKELRTYYSDGGFCRGV